MRPRFGSTGARRVLGSAGRALPWLLLILQIVLCFQFLRGAGRLELHMTGDTTSYRAAGKKPTLKRALANHRTLVYPAVLRYFDRSGRTWKQIPVLQAAIYFVAVVVFFVGLRIYSDSAWLALAAAVPLIYAKSNEFLPWAQTDSLSVSMTLVVFGLLFALAAKPASRLAWVGLGVAVLLSYQTRPSTLFLIALVPVLAVVLRLCRTRCSVRGMAVWAAGLAATTFVPYLLYALLRLVVVGHFGLVAFGGANLIGATSMFLDKWVVKALPPGETKVLARRMKARRDDRSWWRLEFDIPIEYYYDQYDVNVWRIAVPVTRRRFRERTEPELRAAATEKDGYPPSPLEDPRPRWIEQNQMMLDLAREIIRLRPYRYWHWVQQGWRYGLGKVPEDGWIFWPLALLGISLPLAWLRGRPAEPAPVPGGPERSPSTILLGLWIAAAAYFLLHMTLVCLLSYPLSRYVVAATVLWPPCLAALLFEVWRGIVASYLGPAPESL